MQELIPAMGGIVVAAYKDFDENDHLLRELNSLASSKRLLFVESPNSTGFSSTTGQSEQRALAVNDHSCAIEIVERRVDLLKSMGAVFTSVQELAASVIFVKAPTALNDSAFSSNLANYAGSSIHVMSFPEHLSLWSTSTVEHENEEIILSQKEHGKDVKGSHFADVMIREDPKQLTEPHYDSVEEPEKSNINIVQVPVMGRVSSLSSMSERETDFGKCKDMDLSAWKSSRVLRRRDVKPEQKEDDIGMPVVVNCELIVKKQEPYCLGEKIGHSLMNYKRFKKGNGCKLRSSTASSMPQQTIGSVVDNADRVAFRKISTLWKSRSASRKSCLRWGKEEPIRSCFRVAESGS